MNTSKLYWEIVVLMSGAIAALAFSPFDYSYLLIISLALLFASWSGVSSNKAAVRGFLFGLAYFGVGVSWVYISVHKYGGANIFISGLITCVFVVFWSLFTSLAGFIANILLVNKCKYLNIIVCPLAWTICEFIRGDVILNGFPWLLISYSQLESPLAGYLPIIGAYGTSLLLALTASLLLNVVIQKKFRLLITCSLLVLWGTGEVLKTIQWTHKIGGPIKVTLIQGNIEQENKWLPENRAKTLRLYRELTQQNWGSQIIIWPETAVPAFYDSVEEGYLNPLEKLAKQTNTDLVISIPVRIKEGEYYNSVITLGKHRTHYHKIHLLPFGEYLPLQPLSGYLLKQLKILPLGGFTAGKKEQDLLRAGGYQFVASICYEDAFGNERLTHIERAAFMVNVTNDAWFGDSLEPHQHMQIARMRAVETGRYLMRSTNTGITGVISPKGEIVQQLPMFEVGALTTYIDPMGGITPYSKTGDKWVICSLIILTIWVCFYNWYYKNFKRKIP